MVRRVDIVRTPASGFSFGRAKTVAGVAVVASTLGLGSTAWRSAAPAVPTVDKGSVWTDHVRRGDLLRQVPVQGTLVPEHVQWLSATTAARVKQIVVRPGATVEPDTVVVVLENAELELAALEAERQAASAESALIQLDWKTQGDEKLQLSTLAGLRSDLRDAERRAAAADKLAPEGLMGALDHGDAIGKAKGLGERVEVEEARRHVLLDGRARQLSAQRTEVDRLRDIAAFRRRQLASLEVRAGIRGVVQEVPLENGQWVAIGTVLAKVAEPDHLKADVKVSETSSKDVHRGLAVRFEMPASSSIGNFRGHITRVDPSVVAGNVRLEVALDGDVPAARADQAVTGYVEIEKLERVLYVARPAGAQEGSSVGVFRIDADGARASRTTARLGRGSAREVEVLGGLTEGDEIIVSDSAAWEPADTIKLK
jgi:multidrug resistance efflux pump